jgi:hypothetical protein
LHQGENVTLQVKDGDVDEIAELSGVVSAATPRRHGGKPDSRPFLDENFWTKSGMNATFPCDWSNNVLTTALFSHYYRTTEWGIPMRSPDRGFAAFIPKNCTSCILSVNDEAAILRMASSNPAREARKSGA